jgi:hypothetical protein
MNSLVASKTMMSRGWFHLWRCLDPAVWQSVDAGGYCVSSYISRIFMICV